jgi:transposase
MRGQDEQQLGVFSYVSPEQRIPQDHPLRQLRAMADEALRELKPRFSRLYAKSGRPTIAPEKLLRALPLQVLYFRAQRTDADGAARLQLVVPLVCGTEHWMIRFGM